MIRISRKCEYALKAVFELAVRSDGGTVKMHRIAGAQNIPPRFLEVILNELRHGGFVQSRRGKVGGYMLALPADSLTVKQIVEYIDGPIAPPAEDRLKPGAAYFYGDKAFSMLWANVADTVAAICDDTTIAELIEREKQSRAEAVLDYAI